MSRIASLAKAVRERPGRVRAAATALVAIAVLAIALGPFALSGAESRQLSAYSDGLRDLSAFRAEIADVAKDAGGDPRAIATSPFMLGSLAEPAEHVLFVFGVESPYTRAETRAVLEFVAAGGTLVLANDVGNANPLAQEFGVVFFDKTILDRENYLDNPRLVEVDVPFGGRDYRVVMNAPAYATVVDESRAKVVATSSADSFIDVDDDGEISVKDTPGPFPLVLTSSYGEGRVVVLADTGLFTNEMQALAGYENVDFARALAASATGGRGAPLIDESRHSGPPAAAGASGALRAFVLATSTPVVRAFVGLGALAIAVVAVLLTRDTEDWSVHAFDVGRALEAPESVRPTPERLQALAARAVCERYNIPFEYLESAPVDEIARLTGDRELAAVAKGVERPGNLPALYAKLTDSVSSAPVTLREEVIP